MSLKIADIETKPKELAQIIHLRPQFEAPSSYKDPIKIAAYILEKERKWLDEAALSAITGEVLAIGLKDTISGQYDIFEGDEKEMLQKFWSVYREGNELLLHCGHNFDLPFLMRRSWYHRVSVPQFNQRWEQLGIYDTMTEWSAKQKGTEGYITLNLLSLFLGTGEKREDGEFFYLRYAKDRQGAMDYLKKDLDLTEANGRILLPQLFTKP